MKPKARRTTTLCINSHAGGIAFVRPNGFGIDFVRYSISGSALWFFVFILKFIFRLIFKIKIMKKNPWHQKNFISEARFLLTNIYLTEVNYTPRKQSIVNSFQFYKILYINWIIRTQFESLKFWKLLKMIMSSQACLTTKFPRFCRLNISSQKIELRYRFSRALEFLTLIRKTRST